MNGGAGMPIQIIVCNETADIHTHIHCFVPGVARAQWSFDFPSVEAYIADHKTQRSLLLARATLEQSNNLLHEYSADAAEDYKVLNFDLDKYTRAFDVIDVLYQSLRTALNARDTYTTVTNRISDYRRMLNDYNEKIVKRAKIEVTDTIIIAINLRAIQKNRERRKSSLQIAFRPDSICDRGGGLLDKQSADDFGIHKPVLGFD